MTMDFGAINKIGGERHLNVAITKARSEMIVFSSIGVDEIDLARTSSKGVKDLKHFFDYADRGIKALGAEVSGSVGDFESPFEIAVECNGATYHRSATARDRDKVREEILSRLGWNLLRLWSTDCSTR